MKLNLGSRDVRIPGFLNVDIDKANKPDILCDVTHLESIASGSVEEIVASHILEHIAWPHSYRALAEWTRVLKVGGVLRLAVPDLKLLAERISRNMNSWRAVSMLYGVYRLNNRFEGHQFGYTSEMLTSMLTSLGHGDFDYWEDSSEGAQSGWEYGDNQEKIAISLNIASTKTSPPVVDPARFSEQLEKNLEIPFPEALTNFLCLADAPLEESAVDPLLLHRIHFKMIEFRQRSLQLEAKVKKLEDRLKRKTRQTSKRVSKTRSKQR